MISGARSGSLWSTYPVCSTIGDVSATPENHRVDICALLWNKWGMDALLERPKRTSTLRTRCEPEVEVQIKTLAHYRRLDVSDVIREALYQYLDRQHDQIRAH